MMVERREIHIERVEWDDWNRVHVARHGVTPEEADDVCFGPHVAIGSYKGRFLLVGRTERGRVLGVVVGPNPVEAGTYYVFTARPASRKERRYLAEHLGEVTR